MLNHDAPPWALKAEKLHKEYPGLTAVKGLDFTVPGGVVHGFLGPNGAGKSTTLRMLCGLLRPTTGRALVQGFDPQESPFEVKSRIGLLPENPPLYRDMTVREYLLFVARLHQVPAAKVAASVERVLVETNTTQVADRLIGNLSKGYRQRVGIAQALVHDPAVIVLDEPTAGLDPESVVEVRALIRELKKSKTVIFSSHLLHEVEEICDTISIIAHGELLAHGPLSEVRERFTKQSEVSVMLATCSEKELHQIRQSALVVAAELHGSHPHVLLRVRLKGNEEHRPELVRLLVSMGLDVLGVEKQNVELEQIFLTLTRQGGER
jgi:ABC-2 type transport system ATP-binding protein